MSTLYYVVYGSALSAPSAAQIKAGQNVNGVAAVASGNATGITTTQSPYTFAAATGLTGSASYKVSFVWSDGSSDSNVVTSDAFTTLVDIQSGAGSSSGTSTAAATGAARTASAGSAAGTATAAATGASTAASAGSSAGAATAAGTGASVAAASGSAAGAATPSGAGASTAASAGSAAGTSTASAVGEAQQAGSASGSASGTSTATGVGASIAAAAGSAAGSSSASGASPQAEPPEATKRRGVPPPQRPRLRWRVQIGEETYAVATLVEANALLEQAREQAESEAKQTAERLAQREKVRMRAARRAAPKVAVQAAEPTGATEVAAIQERVAQVNARLQQVYVDALRDALIAQALHDRIARDEEDALAVLML